VDRPGRFRSARGLLGVGGALVSRNLPIPMKRLEGTLQDVRRHVTRSTAENRTSDAVFA
jgi:hypothetical protein